MTDNQERNLLNLARGEHGMLEAVMQPPATSIMGQLPYEVRLLALKAYFGYKITAKDKAAMTKHLEDKGINFVRNLYQMLAQ